MSFKVTFEHESWSLRDIERVREARREILTERTRKQPAERISSGVHFNAVKTFSQNQTQNEFNIRRPDLRSRRSPIKQENAQVSPELGDKEVASYTQASRRVHGESKIEKTVSLISSGLKWMRNTFLGDINQRAGGIEKVSGKNIDEPEKTNGTSSVQGRQYVIPQNKCADNIVYDRYGMKRKLDSRSHTFDLAA